MLRPLQLMGPHRLAVVWETSPRLPVPVMVVSPPNLEEWKRRTRSFEALGAFQLRGFTVTLRRGSGQGGRERGMTMIHA